MINYFFLNILKKSSIGLVSSGGRNFLGRICVFHRGGGKKRRYLLVDRFRRLNNFGRILKILKKSFVTSFIGFLVYDNGLLSFITISKGVFLNSRIFSVLGKPPFFLSKGSSMCINHAKLFSVVNSVELYPFSGAKVARAAGCSAVIIGCKGNSFFLKMNSGWQLKVFSNCVCVLGIVSNQLHYTSIIGKAGLSRSFGRRPVVRGVAKNACDHPHGGGEGKGSPPVAQVTPWGILTKGRPTLFKKRDFIRRKFYKIF